MDRTACPDPQEMGEAVLGLPASPEVLRHLEDCPACQREAVLLVRFLPEPDPGYRPPLTPGNG